MVNFAQLRTVDTAPLIELTDQPAGRPPSSNNRYTYRTSNGTRSLPRGRVPTPTPPSPASVNTARTTGSTPVCMDESTRSSPAWPTIWTQPNNASNRP